LLSGLTNIFASLNLSFSAVAPEHLGAIPQNVSLLVCDLEFFHERHDALTGVPVVVFTQEMPVKEATAAFLSATAPTQEVLEILRSFLDIEDPVIDQPLLSAREREILALVCTGLTNDEIAANCFVSTATVKTHLLRTFRKLGVSDRAAAVYRALKLGLIN
jgi:ATP/maltotriose-dependent transcriptional regulator MalT